MARPPIPAAASASTLVAADVALTAIPLDRTIRLGTYVTREREYAALRLRTAAGLEGFALGYTRGLPLAQALLGFAGEIVGCDAAERVANVARLERMSRGAPTDIRALSLVEIALWDLEAKSAGQPLWRLLGGDQGRAPILAVGGYFLDERSLTDVEDEFRALVASGFRHVKVHAHDPVVIERLRDAVAGDAAFSIDLHMRFATLEQAMPECVVLDQLGLGFIEDPFPPDRPDLTAALADCLETPIAAGEDASGEAGLTALARAADVLRVDATTSGGIAAALRAASEAAALGHLAMTHAFVEMHAQLADGATAVSLAETIPYASGANPVDRLLRRSQTIEAGSLVLSQEPGHGLAVDWSSVSGHARFATTLTPTKGKRWN